MAKVKKKAAAPTETFQFPLKRTNFFILAFGILVLVVGYVLMALPDNPDDFLTRTLAPVLLVIAFLVIIPAGLLYKEKEPGKQ